MITTRILTFLLTLTLSMPSVAQGEKKVYICTGKYAKRYHKTKSCKGLNNCKGEIRTITFKEASKRRTPCKICYRS